MMLIQARKTIVYLLVPEGATYDAPEESGWCAYNSAGSKHENCKCDVINEDFVMCKDRCDTDHNCKGYSYRNTGNENNACWVYTTSSCTGGCAKDRKGKLGDLIQHSVSNSPESGCYKKIGSKSLLLQMILTHPIYVLIIINPILKIL